MIYEALVVMSQVDAPPIDNGSAGVLAWVCGILVLAIAGLWFWSWNAIKEKDKEVSRLTNMMVEKNDKLQETLTRLIERKNNV